MSDLSVSGLLALNDKKDAKIGELTARIRELDELIVDLSNETYPALKAENAALRARAENAEAAIEKSSIYHKELVAEHDDMCGHWTDIARSALPDADGVSAEQISAAVQALAGADGEAVGDE